MVPSPFTPPGTGLAVPSTEPSGNVNQNETSSPGVKPRAVITTTSPARPPVGTASPFLLPEVSQPTGVFAGTGVLVGIAGGGATMGVAVGKVTVGVGPDTFCRRNVPSCDSSTL